MIKKNSIQTVGLPYLFRYLKKKKKKTFENDQLTGHFQSFFIFFFRPPNPKSEKKNSRKSTNKKILALVKYLPFLQTNHQGFQLVWHQKVSEYDQEIPQTHTLQTNPWHHEEEPQFIYSNKTYVRQ